MKIGVITFWQSEDNYGQILQIFAMQHFLRKLGHKPFLIRYKEDGVRKQENGIKVNKLLDYIFNFRSYFRYFLQLRRDSKYRQLQQNYTRKFKEFIAENIEISPQVYSDTSIMETPPEADVYLCGSDQIWGGNEIYYLPFAPEGHRKIAYAPSFGGVNPFEKNNSDRIKELLRNFDFIGVREESGAMLLQSNGIGSATHVVDPTLLLGKEDYLPLVKPTDTYTFAPASDVFLYLLGSPIKCSVDKIISFLKKNDLSYSYVASQGRVDKYPKSQFTIPEWLEAIKRSKMVITNSFHCIVFSLIFHKPFLFIPLDGSYSRMNNRITELLGKCGLQSRIYSGDFKIIFNDVDFERFDNYRSDEMNRSKSLLSHVLNKV